ncbi:hypothetical protein [Bauldia sp.]|uniref:hypothetical protein n=1 Tax=Bauldia sp. TaxID=2575872 RepID=UPI003BA8A65A
MTDDGFFEGGWAQAEEPEALRLSGIHLGSGASWRSGRLTLISPSHARECIWVAESKEGLWAANFLALLVAATRPEGFDIWRARAGIRTLTRGLRVYRRIVFEGDDIVIKQFANAFVEATPTGFSETQQRQTPGFADYEGYIDFLLQAMRETVDSFGGAMTVYLSRGYDSPGLAALAKTRFDRGDWAALMIGRSPDAWLRKPASRENCSDRRKS